MHARSKAATDMTTTDLSMFDEIPKTVLYAIAKHLAARADTQAPGYDTSLESGSYVKVIKDEWKALHESGIVPQKLPKSFGIP
jgi:hypothetical protein